LEEVIAMINQITVNKLREMRLGTMADALKSQSGDDAYDTLSFDDRFGILVDAEWSKRRSVKLQKLIYNAGFPEAQACIEGIDYLPDRELDKSLILKLASCTYINEGRHLILKGASGCGKTYLGSALGNAACRRYISVKYIRLPELLNDLVVARGEGTLKKAIASYRKVGLLILDEWLLKPLTTDQAMDLFEIIEARSRRGSMIFCTQFDPRGWYDRIGAETDGTVSEAIIDRIKHNAYEIHMKGKISMREHYGIKRQPSVEIHEESNTPKD
jgi:DNA replication protein DnaC